MKTDLISQAAFDKSCNLLHERLRLIRRMEQIDAELLEIAHANSPVLKETTSDGRGGTLTFINMPRHPNKLDKPARPT